MKHVSRFEADLLRMLHGIVERAPRAQVLAIVAGNARRPECLSRDAVELVQEALAKGCVLSLARAGGWRPGRHLHGQEVRDGRLWERWSPQELGLTFSRCALEFLIQLTALPPAKIDPRSRSFEKELDHGDGYLYFLTYIALRDSEAAAPLRKLSVLRSHGLCWLAFPGDFADNLQNTAPAFAPWLSGVGPAILEAVQPRLVESWLELEYHKRGLTDRQRLRLVGEAQERTLNRFLDAIDAAGRHDLAWFLLVVVATLLREPRAQEWIANVDVQGLRLADRLATYQAAVAVPRQMDRLEQWERQARGVGYFDDGYQAAQLWKADWERHDGAALASRARAIIAVLQPMA